MRLRWLTPLSRTLGPRPSTTAFCRVKKEKTERLERTGLGVVFCKPGGPFAHCKEARRAVKRARANPPQLSPARKVGRRHITPVRWEKFVLVLKPPATIDGIHVFSGLRGSSGPALGP